MINRNNRLNKRKKLSMKGFMNKNRSTNANILNNNNLELKEGDKGENVERLQKMLNGLVNTYPNLPIVVVDGNFGSYTKSALIKYQEANNLKASGIVDIQTWNKLNLESREKIEDDMYFDESNNIVKMGSKGRYVIDLQKYLNKIAEEYISIPKLEVDGIFGIKTKTSLIEFQKLFNLVPDGVATDMTWEMLYNVYNKVNK